MGTLYLVSTPIGDPEDITLRALRVLRSVSLVAAQRAPDAARMLAGYAIQVPCIAYHEHNRLARLDEVLAALEQGDVALVAGEGTPVLAAPGVELVNACVVAGHRVVPVPGPNAPLAALVASGLPADQFLCLGALPPRRAQRRALLQRLADLSATLVGFEEPHRLCDTLEDLLAILGDRRLALAHDVTRRGEGFFRGRIAQALAHYAEHRPRGLFTLVVEGHHWREGLGDDQELPSEAEVAARLRQLRDQGRSGSAAARQVARELGLRKSLVYQVWLSLGEPAHEGGEV
ncbi:MAG TPA: 16S rRNA (cytidine(1402)-2'-O)-methyltransferase [Roseiflexaceae bacterium]|nr:16S rRNA (cytidine(1402)-2'-O)-methyltransferase [Roseiflexaceae bacterium]